MKMYLNFASALVIAGITNFAMPNTAWAQDTSANFEGDEIIVTARARAESIQDVPLSITAFDEEALLEKSIQGLDDIARFTSGFSFESFSGGFATPVIRGQAQTRVTALESNVSSFLDGVYIPRSWAVDIGTTNLSRVEVVKGPQSARYGRNAFSGAINYVPRKADLGTKLAAELSGTIGSDDRYDVGAFINIAQTDKIAVAGSFNYSTFDGSWDNDHPFADDLDLAAGTDGNVGGWNNTSFSASLAAQPTENLNVEAAYYTFDVEAEARASRYIANTVGTILTPGQPLEVITNCGSNNVLFCGELPEPADSVLVDPRSFGPQSNTDIIRLALNYELSDALTFGYTFGNVSGDVITGTSGEPDPINCGTLVGPPFFVPLCNFQSAPIGGIDYDSHEARLTWDNSGQIRGAIGGFYSKGEDSFQFTSFNIGAITDANNFAPLIGSPVPGNPFTFFQTFMPVQSPFNINLTDETIETDTISGFAEIQWTSEDGLIRLGAEGRYSSTEITASDNRAPGFMTPPRLTGESETFNVFTPRLTGEYDLNADTLLYGSVARGAKAGGFNVSTQNAEFLTFDPEFNWTYELGFKSRLAGGRATLNGAIFYTDWTDIQINSADIDPNDPANPNVPTVTANLGDAEVFGFELDARFQATDNLSFDATFSHTESTYGDGTIDSRFSRGVNATPFAPAVPPPCDDIVCNSNGEIGGNDVERTTPTQASFGAQWDDSFGSNGDYFIRGDLSWQSDFFAESANLSTIPSRFLVNGRAGINLGNVDVSIWARNLFDKKYVSNAFVVLLPAPNPNTYGTFFGERRTFGLTGKVKY